MGKLFLLLVGLVVLELTVMIEVGSVIGALPTVGLLILTAVLGSSLVRSEGIKTLFNAQQKMQQGEMPGREVMGGMMLALAGLLLIIPGFVTDFFGILLLQPWLRNKLADKLIGSNQFKMQMGGFQARQQPFDEVPGNDQPGQAAQRHHHRRGVRAQGVTAALTFLPSGPALMAQLLEAVAGIPPGQSARRQIGHENAQIDPLFPSQFCPQPGSWQQEDKQP